MAEPFKNVFNKKMITQMAGHIQRVWPDFDKNAFVRTAANQLEVLELKQRCEQVTEALIQNLPYNYKRSVNILLKSLAPEHEKEGRQGVTGWGSLIFTRYISLQGLEYFDLSMNALKEMTKRLTAEFDIRFFLISDQARAIKFLKVWATDKNHHVRRLVSEGARPRLPWAIRLQSFVNDPKPILPLLELLKDDDEEYVRRSVANNLNDISKDHSKLVTKIAKAWLKGADQNRKRLVKHACRTLIKQGCAETLKALGYGDPQIVLEKLTIQTSKVQFGQALIFDIVLSSTAKKEQNLIIDYAIHHRKANGCTTPKVFKWKNIVLTPVEKHKATKKHAIKKVTTRTYYNGEHSVEMLVNGVSFAKKSFKLIGV